MGNGNQIFLSYSNIDQGFAKKLSNDLKTHGISVWFDKSKLLPGDKFFKEIASEIESSKWFICILSPSYKDSRSCDKELNHALSYHIEIIPILYKDCDINGFLADTEYADMRDEEEYGNELNKILTKIRHVDTNTLYLSNNNDDNSIKPF